MAVRSEFVKPRRETGARSLKALRRIRAVRRGSEERARRPKACCNGGSAASRFAETDDCSRRVMN